MFEGLIREVRKLERTQTISVPIPEDEEGYVDRQCPNDKCKAEFKVLGKDWDSKVPNNRAYCPVCRHAAPSDDWATPAQVGYVKAVALARLKRQLHGALESGAHQFNQRQRPGFITFSLSVSRDTTPILLPCAVADVMRQRFTCERCQCNYSSVGAAFFCPACGHNSVMTTFVQTIETVRNTVGALATIRQAMADDPDAAHNAVRMLLEQSMGRLVGAFEHYAEELFATIPSAPHAKVKRGTFQRLDEASGLWREAVGKRYQDLLSPQEMARLVRFVQQRHLLTHANGIVDDAYIAKSADTTYAVGQRVVIQESDVVALADLLAKLAAALRTLSLPAPDKP
jgi:Zn finger protein HypA/HybF involved in hydrogenase expression